MEDLAEVIVKKARTTPIDLGVSLEANGVVIAKVAVTGGHGIEVRHPTGKTLLFPLAELEVAVQCFMTTYN